MEGWKEYEWRWEIMKLAIGKKLQTIQPEWEPGLKGRVLLWPEQGVGDEILYASLIPDFIEHIDKLIVQIDRRLIPLFKRTFGNKVDFYPRKECIDEKDYDYHIAMGSLPTILRSSMETFTTVSNTHLTLPTKA